MNNNTLWSQLSGLFGSGGAQSFPAGDTAAGMTTGAVPTTGALNQDQLASRLKGMQGGSGTGLGFNIGTGQLALGGLSALANLWGANKQMKLAEDQFDFTKKIATTNLNNQVKSYNTTLEDRIRSRAAMEGSSSAEAEAYLNKNRLNA